GILRDRISRLYDCDLIVLSKVKDIHSESVKEKFNYLKRFKKNIIISKLTYNSISNGNSSIEFEKISGMKISLFCGVGNPKDFFDIFSKYTIAGLKAFPDHCKYENNFFELKKIKKEADILITTYKDFVKLGETTINELNIYYLDIDLKFYDQGLKEISLSDLIGERVFEKK
ncbi:MAG: tetraacyldisaccharide 4'-kinase, partial [Candidatus Delongbacteria bacterium]|nr:tetraacyldisaccharide 4'-kinase [Candidatus Delongbacteria bacterium]